MSLSVTPAQTMLADRQTYPAMLPREILIFKGWLAQHETEYDRFEFNVRVGSGVDPGPGFSDSARQSGILNSQKRIDAVGWQGSQATIIEVKFRAGASAIGQLVVYTPLFKVLRPDLAMVKMALVTDQPQPDLDPALQALGITLYAIPTDFSSLANPPAGQVIVPGVDAGSVVL